jgi:transcriptional regulator GlxA family with amidase domain
MNSSFPPTRSVLLLVPEEGLLFEAAGLADIFHRANLLLEADSSPNYRVTVASTLRHRLVHGRSGLNLLADVCLVDLDPNNSWDTLIVTGGGGAPDETSALADWLKLAAPRARRVVSVCSGAFVLAEAGLLDGRRATTHWNSADELKRLFPRILVETDPIYVHDGPFWTSAGASSGFDLALALVEDDQGAEIARKVAQYLVLFLRRPGGQSQFSRFLEGQAAGPGPIRDLQVWALEHLAENLGVERLAERVAMSPRNFARVFVQQTGVTPARFVEQIRVEAARQRLEQGRETVDGVASACGLGTALTLRRTFERHLGVTPSEYRARFGLI